MPRALTWRSAATARRDVSGAMPAHSVHDRLGFPLCSFVVVAAWSSPWNPGASQVEGGCARRSLSWFGRRRAGFNQSMRDFRGSETMLFNCKRASVTPLL